MRIAPTRLLTCGLLALPALAVGLGRALPEARWRSPRPARYAVVNSYLWAPQGYRSHLLDADAGAIVRLGLPGRDVLASAGCSPWRDERGDWHLAGMGWSYEVRGGSLVGRDYGLMRLTHPGGRVLNRVPIEVVPAGPPCWEPGTAARVLFGANDGRLYRFAFEGSCHADAGPGGCDPRPEPLDWAATAPRPAGLGDAAWPADPRLGRRVFVALTPRPDGGRDAGKARPRLWWLALDRRGVAIVGAGRLIRAGGAGAPGGEDVAEHGPALWAGPDGGLMLAYLAERPGSGPWRCELRVAPVRIEGLPGGGARALGRRPLRDGAAP
jgi:hypothetical protein